jgi:sodium/potassium-transporting ATPase subunit alpha
LIKFTHPILDINQARAQFPTFQYVQDENLIDCLIPFNSEIKFNMFIRDMNKNNRNPSNKKENLTVFMKGAPERILSRCSKILIQGVERDFDEDMKKEVDKANDAFGGLGERVLAFARCELDPAIFSKDPAYQFDIKNWKNWKDVKNRDPSIKGWFPMFNLTLVGLTALNDPPRIGVPRSVSLCKQAGIKVIMVTGDQPPTAAAIAHQVNIITNPKLEYNVLMKEEGLSHEEAWAKCKAIVIHGDLLAHKH